MLYIILSNEYSKHCSYTVLKNGKILNPVIYMELEKELKIIQE